MPDNKPTLPLEEIILGIALTDDDRHVATEPHALEDIWGDAEILDEIGEPKWLEDIDPEPAHEPCEPRFSRRQLLGLPTIGREPTQRTEQQAKRRRFMAMLGLSSVCLVGVGLYISIDDETPTRGAAAVSTTTMRQGSEASFVPTTSTTLPPPVIVLPGIPTLPPEATMPETTLAPTTVPPETVPATLPPETAPPTTQAPQEVPATTLPLYGTVDCAQDTAVIVRGMTFSGLAEYCGLRVETLQSYNPSFQPETDFITGRTIRLRPGVGGATSSLLAKECPAWFGTKKRIAPGFRVIDYLQNDIGLSPSETSRLVYDSTLLDDYDLDVVTANTDECLPTVSALQVRYGATL